MIKQPCAKKKVSLNAFIKLVIGFQLLTVLLFVFGPREWKGINKWYVLLYVIANCIGLYIGYRFAIKRCHNIKIAAGSVEAGAYKEKYFRILMILSMIILFIDMINTIKVPYLSFNTVIDAIKLGFTNPSAAYYKDSGIVIGGQIFIYLKVLTAPLVWSSIPLGIYYFKKLGKTLKIVLIINIVLEALKWIGCGTNKGLFDLIVIFIAVYFVKLIKNGSIAKKSLKKIIAIIFLLFICGIIYFGISIASRIGNEISYDTTFYTINERNIFWRLCPNALKSTFNNILGYATQGYYGLGLAFNESPVFMYGIGNSPFLVENIEQILNISLQSSSLQYKIYLSTGWHYTVNWHSIYTWIANDVTIYFVPFIMIIIGNLFGRIVVDIKCHNNNTSIVLFVLMTISFFYFSANNQIMAYPTTAFTFIVGVVVWFLRSRAKRSVTKKAIVRNRI